MQRINALFLILLLVFAAGEGYGFSLTRLDQSWCVTSFPTSYVSGSFVFAETTAAEITKNQSNRTIFFDVPAGFQFNTTGGTYSVTGTSANDITAISISSITTTRITVRVTVSNSTQIDLNTITVNCQINATTSGSSGTIYRSGGTLKINRSTSIPSGSDSFGNLSAYTKMAFSSSTTAQPVTTSVPQAINDVEIIQVQVIVTGTCSALNLTQLAFNTDGNNGTGSNTPASNISAARVYYTGTTNSFAPTGLFGSVNTPSGAFTISGTQELTSGTNYFWLVYDVPAGAIAGELLDATCTSLTIDGGVGAQTPTLQNPTGSRTISGSSQFYTRASGNWSDLTNWSLSDGGASCSCMPNSTSNVFINTNHLIQLNTPDTVGYLTIKDGGRLYDNGSSLLLINNNLTTQGSGNIQSSSQITINGNLVLSGSGKSTTSSSFTVKGNTTIGSNTSLTSSASAANNITLQGQLAVTGALSSGTGGATIIMNGASTQTISGTGTINGTGTLTLSTSAKTIATGTSMSIDPPVNISGTITVTNNGTITLKGDLTGSVSGSTWTNAANSILNAEGAILTTGTLTATASPNTVNYSGSSAQTIKATTYHILKLSNAGTKTFAGATIINNELHLSGTSIGVAGTNTINGAGKLTMIESAEFTIAKTGVTVPELTGIYSLTGGTVTLNGTAAATQTVKAATYYNLTLDGSNASSQFDLTSITDIANNLTVQNRSIMTNNGILSVSGNFTYSSSSSSTLANDLTVNGTSTLSGGTLNLNAKYFTTAGFTLGASTTLTATSSTIEITDVGGWTNNGTTFTATGSTVLFSGTGNQTIGGTSSTTFNHLTLNNTGASVPQFTLGNNIQVNGMLTFTLGSMNLNANTLTLGTSAASNGTLVMTSGWTYGGTFKRWYPASTISNGAAAALCPLGTSADSRYCYINAPSSAPSSGGTISVSHTNSTGLSTVSFSDGATTIDRRYDAYWTISTADGLTGGTWNIQSSGTGLNAISSVSLLRLTNAAGVSGTAGTNAGTVSNPQVNRTGLTLAQLSNNFYWGYSQTALPVELINFAATPLHSAIQLKWSTASERNSSHFKLYRADNNQQYHFIGMLQSKGNTSAVSNYIFVDGKPLSGINYYKLFETDIDGHEEYLGIASASYSNKNLPVSYSNPVDEILELHFSNLLSTEVNVRIYDSTGRLLRNEKVEMKDGGNDLYLDCSTLNTGVYMLTITNSEQLFQGRFVRN